MGRRGRRRRGSHGAEIEVGEVVGQDEDSRRHDLRCPVILENGGHVVDWDDREDNLRVGKDTMGMPEPMTLEQHSQVMSWLSLILRLYWAESNFPEQVGLIYGVFGIRNCSRMALSP